MQPERNLRQHLLMNDPARQGTQDTHRTDTEFDTTQVIVRPAGTQTVSTESTTVSSSGDERIHHDANDQVIAARGVSKRFKQGDLDVSVLEDLDFSIASGERVAIVGSSGSGKSTLLHLLGGLDSPTTGEIEVAGQRMDRLSPAERGRLRNRMMGFVYQFHHLLPEFSALENVAMPLLIGGQRKGKSIERAKELLARVGLGERYRHKPGELSGGERQRAAIARALINDPRVVLADEPTGNLDEDTSSKVYELMLELNKELNTSFIIVTHDVKLAARMDRTLTMRQGTLL